eukprot:g5106.t1
MRFEFCASFVILFVVSNARQIPHSRSFIERSTSRNTSCQNTKTGKYYLADNRGRICERKSLDYLTGCCPEGNQFSCETCEDDSCCSRYENCVTCCLKPSNNASKKYLTTHQVRSWEESGKWSSEFEYCQGICRTWTYSTVHENAFLNSRRFCFSDFGRPLIPETEAPPIPNSVQPIKSKTGEDCTSTCKQANKSCMSQGFASLNNCNILREHFICEAGCSELSESHGVEPYYITGSAEKKNFPAYCVRHQPSPDLTYDCDWKASHVKRLCPCTDLQ